MGYDQNQAKREDHSCLIISKHDKIIYKIVEEMSSLYASNHLHFNKESQQPKVILRKPSTTNK